MDIREAQQEVKLVYWGGSVGQAVSSIIWLVSAALSTWVSPRSGILALVLVGIFIFPLTQVTLKILGKRASLSKANPFKALAMQVAFIVPVCIPLILSVNKYDVNLFYPAFLIVVGAHYLPFITLYGMWEYGILAGVFIFSGVGIRMLLPGSFTLGGWAGGVSLMAFALYVWWSMEIQTRRTGKLEIIGKGHARALAIKRTFLSLG